VGHKLAMIETEPDMTFTLFGIDEQLPLNYRLATVQEVEIIDMHCLKPCPAGR
jgi:hypothetical protein